ncbi:MAG: glutamate racemase [Lachnospiraceae bacterium]|uniref:Glutamate racemase n=1 Tax=Candidatus Weimeria bifida TaxID=2599074 RepID=A0A6N7J035_9FIRM|nr:glutamate racemase [Candidatus Weimeria bifida]RRF96420.1 MAG: glutamate racemase [Lachnospiraceae bacterium]
MAEIFEPIEKNDIIHAPIAVFDSGVGGVSVLRELVRVMPKEKFYFYGDSGNAPYGTKSRYEVLQLTRGHVEDFIDMGVKGICIACNTATSAAVRQLRLDYPEVPVVGIEPALKPAVSFMHHPKVLVMATPMTIRENKFQNLLNKYGEEAEVFPLACPGLMEYVEAGKAGTEEVQKFLNDLLKDYAPGGKYGPMDAVVTGCTHYPFVKDQIETALGGGTRVFDGANGTAREMRRRLFAAGSLIPEERSTEALSDEQILSRVHFENSAPDREAKIELCRKLLLEK